MDSLIFTNQFKEKISIYSIYFENDPISFAMGKFPKHSNQLQSFQLESGQSSNEVPFDRQYPYMIVVYTKEDGTYGIFYIISLIGANKTVNIQLTDEDNQTDMDSFLSYHYVNAENKSSVIVPVLSNDITSFINQSSNENNLKIGEGDMALNVDTKIIEKVSTLSKQPFSSRPELNIRDKIEIAKALGFTLPVVESHYVFGWVFFWVFILIVFVCIFLCL